MSQRVTPTREERDAMLRGNFVRLRAVRGTVLVGLVDGQWRAYWNVCRHRAVPLDLGATSPLSEAGRFLLCHHHGALYRTRDGVCVAGPCVGEKLAAVGVDLDGDTLVFDSS